MICCSRFSCSMLTCHALSFLFFLCAIRPHISLKAISIGPFLAMFFPMSFWLFLIFSSKAAVEDILFYEKIKCYFLIAFFLFDRSCLMSGRKRMYSVTCKPVYLPIAMMVRMMKMI